MKGCIMTRNNLTACVLALFCTITTAFAGLAPSKPASTDPVHNKLFIITIGGNTTKSHVELHDVRFAINEKIEDTYAGLRKEWWGEPSSLHLDCWGELTWADGYDIQIHADPATAPEKLFFVNLGGYEPGVFAEQHVNVFVVAKTQPEAIAKAKDENFPKTKWGNTAHQDFTWEVEKAVDVTDIAAGQGKHIHLIPSQPEKKFEFTCKYEPIAK